MKEDYRSFLWKEYNDVKEKLKLRNDVGDNNLAELNDDGKTFTEIADMIEIHFEEIFTEPV